MFCRKIWQRRSAVSYTHLDVYKRQPFKRANRMFHPEDSVVDVNGIKIGGKKIIVMAGPCSVETEEQIISVAKSVKLGGAAMLRLSLIHI